MREVLSTPCSQHHPEILAKFHAIISGTSLDQASTLQKGTQVSVFDSWRRERAIRRVLRGLSRQRVAMILQPGSVWVVELAPSESPDLDPILRTCYLRGWVEPIANAVPRGRLTPNGALPKGHLFESEAPIYRLTEGGWQALNRSHRWVVFTAVIATITFIATIVATLVAMHS